MTEERPFADEPGETAAEPIVGPGSGGSPAPPGAPEPDERIDAAREPEVRAVLDELRSDEPAPAEVDYDEAAEQAGTGTDR